MIPEPPQPTITSGTHEGRRRFRISDAAKANQPRLVEVERIGQEFYDAAPVSGYAVTIASEGSDMKPGVYLGVALTDRELALVLALGVLMYAEGQQHGFNQATGIELAKVPTHGNDVNAKEESDEQA